MSLVVKPKHKRKKASDTFPEEVKQFIIDMKKDDQSYSDVVRQANLKFPALQLKMHQAREVILASQAYVQLDIDQGDRGGHC